MRYLPITTLLLWGGIVIGYVYARELILHPLVKFPLVILVSIFLPVSFWYLASRKYITYAIIFLAIFLANSSILTFTALDYYSTLYNFTPHKETRIDPQLAELIVSGEDEETRKLAAQFIYENYGITIPFMTDDEQYVLFSPTESNEKEYLDNSANKAGLHLLKENLKYQTDALLFILAIHSSIFFGVLSYLVLRMGTKESN